MSNQPHRSNDQTFMLNTITTTVHTLSRPPLPLLNTADTYSMKSTKDSPLQTNTILNPTAIQCQILYQTHTALNVGPSSILFSLPSSVNPMSISFVSTQNYTVLFVAMNKPVKTFRRLDHQNGPEEYLHQIDAHMIFSMRGKPLHPVACDQ